MTLYEKAEQALENISEGSNLRDLAQAALNEGITLSELDDVFEQLHALHQNSENEIKYDAVLDTLDYIRGYCSPEGQLIIIKPS